MNILIIIPKYTQSEKPFYDYLFPAGICYISAALRECDHNIKGINLNHEVGDGWDKIEPELSKVRYDCILFSVYIEVLHPILRLLPRIRKSSNHSHIIIGGCLVTSEPQALMEILSVDYAIVGYGERAICELLGCLEEEEEIGNIQGICYRGENGELLHTEQNLDCLPRNRMLMPDYGAFSYSQYLDNQCFHYGNGLYIYDQPRPYFILGSRGCSHDCTFCYHFSLGFQRRAVDDIFAELYQRVIKYHINVIFFNDEITASNKNQLINIASRMKKMIDGFDWEISWYCDLRIDLIDDEVIDILKSSYCYSVGLGLESLDDNVLRSMKKNTVPANIMQTLRIAKKKNMRIIGHFIFGDIAETEESYQKTLKKWIQFFSSQVNLFFLAAYPNSEIYQFALNNGIIINKNDYIQNKFSQKRTTILNFTSMDSKKFRKMKSDIIRSLVANTKYIVPSAWNKKVAIFSCGHCGFKHKYFHFDFSGFFYRYRVYCIGCGGRFIICSRLFKMVSRYEIFLSEKVLFVRGIITKIKQLFI